MSAGVNSWIGWVIGLIGTGYSRSNTTEVVGICVRDCTHT